MKTVDHVNMLVFKHFNDGNGSLVPIELTNQFPFDVKRVFYVYGVPIEKNRRGAHSHYKTEQVLICLNGAIKVTCKDGKSEKTFLLKHPSQALYIPEMIWGEQEYLIKDSVLLVLTNTVYDKNDYVENWQEFLKGKDSGEA